MASTEGHRSKTFGEVCLKIYASGAFSVVASVLCAVRRAGSLNSGAFLIYAKGKSNSVFESGAFTWKIWTAFTVGHVP